MAHQSGWSIYDEASDGQKTATASSGTDSTADANPTHNPQATPLPPTGNVITALLESSRELNFAENLHSILSVPNYHYIVRWNPKGDAFGIYDTTAFVNTVMSTHFQRAKFDSFTRRMRRWGFRPIESMSEKMSGLVIFKCKFFLREKPELCKMMCDDRQRKKRRNSNSPNTTKVVTAMYSHSHSSNKQVGKGQNEPMPVHLQLPIRPNLMDGPVHFPMGHAEQHYNPVMNHLEGLHQPSSLPRVCPQRRHSMEMSDDAVNQTDATGIMPSDWHDALYNVMLPEVIHHPATMPHQVMMPSHQSDMAFPSNPYPHNGNEAPPSSFPPREGYMMQPHAQYPNNQGLNNEERYLCKTIEDMR